jgi:hypothetical protein
MLLRPDNIDIVYVGQFQKRTHIFFSGRLFQPSQELLTQDLCKTLTGGRIFGRNPDKSLQSFLPCYSQSPPQLWLEISISSNSRNLLPFLQFSYCTVYTLQEKGGKPDRTPYPLPYALRNSYINLKSGNSHDYTQKPQRNCTFMNSASGWEIPGFNMSVLVQCSQKSFPYWLCLLVGIVSIEFDRCLLHNKGCVWVWPHSYCFIPALGEEYGEASRATWSWR